LRVTAQLINTEDAFHLGSQRYDRDLNDIFTVQDDIAQAIARPLQLALCDRSAARHRGIPSLPAYEAYLKGLHEVSLVTLDSLTRARD